ncbi:MAG: glycosyltransferase family 4 protein, partial [Verrucomicrobiae bacterium]|nr:glycosyltransferase family 4 protein [Verrucomicrobiae bacterium]
GCPVAVIPNGLPLPLPVARQPGNRLMIGTAARLSPDKRLEDLLGAVRLALPDLPPFELQIAGGPDGGHEAYAKGLRRQARGLPVRWLGELPGTSQFLETCDLFVAISEPAGCPNATLEAMAAGLPVIATDHGGAREQIAHDLTGILVPARQAAPLAEALVRAARDPELRARLGRAARAESERRFTVSRMADDYLAFVGISRKSVPAEPV